MPQAKQEDVAQQTLHQSVDSTLGNSAPPGDSKAMPAPAQGPPLKAQVKASEPVPAEPPFPSQGASRSRCPDTDGQDQNDGNQRSGNHHFASQSSPAPDGETDMPPGPGGDADKARIRESRDSGKEKEKDPGKEKGEESFKDKGREKDNDRDKVRNRDKAKDGGKPRDKDKGRFKDKERRRENEGERERSKSTDHERGKDRDKERNRNRDRAREGGRGKDKEKERDARGTELDFDRDSDQFQDRSREEPGLWEGQDATMPRMVGKGGGLRRRERERERPGDRPEREGRRMPIGPQRTRVPCKFFLAGRCVKGDACPFPHVGVPRTKQEPCKFFLTNTCLKGDDCPYSHALEQFPCKYHHLRGMCLDGPRCRFSHDPISREELDRLLALRCRGERERTGQWLRARERGRDGERDRERELRRSGSRDLERDRERDAVVDPSRPGLSSERRKGEGSRDGSGSTGSGLVGGLDDPEHGIGRKRLSSSRAEGHPAFEDGPGEGGGSPCTDGSAGKKRVKRDSGANQDHDVGSDDGRYADGYPLETVEVLHKAAEFFSDAFDVPGGTGGWFTPGGSETGNMHGGWHGSAEWGRNVVEEEEEGEIREEGEEDGEGAGGGLEVCVALVEGHGEDGGGEAEEKGKEKEGEKEEEGGEQRSGDGEPPTDDGSGSAVLSRGGTGGAESEGGDDAAGVERQQEEQWEDAGPLDEGCEGQNHGRKDLQLEASLARGPHDCQDSALAGGVSLADASGSDAGGQEGRGLGSDSELVTLEDAGVASCGVGGEVLGPKVKKEPGGPEASEASERQVHDTALPGDLGKPNVDPAEGPGKGEGRGLVEGGVEQLDVSTHVASTPSLGPVLLMRTPTCAGDACSSHPAAVSNLGSISVPSGGGAHKVSLGDTGRVGWSQGNSPVSKASVPNAGAVNEDKLGGGTAPPVLEGDSDAPKDSGKDRIREGTASGRSGADSGDRPLSTVSAAEAEVLPGAKASLFAAENPAQAAVLDASEHGPGSLEDASHVAGGLPRLAAETVPSAGGSPKELPRRPGDEESLMSEGCAASASCLVHERQPQAVIPGITRCPEAADARTNQDRQSAVTSEADVASQEAARLGVEAQAQQLAPSSPPQPQMQVLPVTRPALPPAVSGLKPSGGLAEAYKWKRSVRAKLCAVETESAVTDRANDAGASSQPLGQAEDNGHCGPGPLDASHPEGEGPPACGPYWAGSGLGQEGDAAVPLVWKRKRKLTRSKASASAPVLATSGTLAPGPRGALSSGGNPSPSVSESESGSGSGTPWEMGAGRPSAESVTGGRTSSGGRGRTGPRSSAGRGGAPRGQSVSPRGPNSRLLFDEVEDVHLVEGAMGSRRRRTDGGAVVESGGASSVARVGVSEGVSSAAGGVLGTGELRKKKRGSRGRAALKGYSRGCEAAGSEGAVGSAAASTGGEAKGGWQVGFWTGTEVILTPNSVMTPRKASGLGADRQSLEVDNRQGSFALPSTDQTQDLQEPPLYDENEQNLQGSGGRANHVGAGSVSQPGAETPPPPWPVPSSASSPGLPNPTSMSQGSVGVPSRGGRRSCTGEVDKAGWQWAKAAPKGKGFVGERAKSSGKPRKGSRMPGEPGIVGTSAAACEAASALTHLSFGGSQAASGQSGPSQGSVPPGECPGLQAAKPLRPESITVLHVAEQRGAQASAAAEPQDDASGVGFAFDLNVVPGDL